jgi:hypothetical protein
MPIEKKKKKKKNNREKEWCLEKIKPHTDFPTLEKVKIFKPSKKVKELIPLSFHVRE